MVDYSKWDELDSDISDSESDSAEDTRRKGRQGQSPGQTSARSFEVGGGDILEQADVLRLKGNSLFDSGDIPAAMGAYEAQLRLLEGRSDEGALDMISAALLNQASALIRLRKFGEAEARCTRLLASAGSTGGDGGFGDVQARALHFRGFARLRQGLFKGACSDLKSTLAAGDQRGEEARALLAEAEAGAAFSSCRDPEAKARALLRENQAAEAAKYFRDAASRARRRYYCRNAQPKSGSERGGSEAGSALGRNLRMEGIAVSASGDPLAAEMLLRGGLKELRSLGVDVDATLRKRLVEEEGLMLSALGTMLGQQRKHQEAVGFMREAVDRLEDAIARPLTRQNAEGYKSNNDSTNLPPLPSTMTTGAGDLPLQLARTLACLGSELLKLQSRSGGGGKSHSCPGSRQAANAQQSDDSRLGLTTSVDEIVRVLERALLLIKAEAAEVSKSSGAEGAVANVGGVDGGGDCLRGEVGERDYVRHQAATVLDSLSEAYARGKRWEKARSAAEQAVTAWRSLDEPLRAGAAVSLLALGHILLQLHGVGAVLDEASARWEEAVACVNDFTRPLEAADVRLKVAGYYTAVARADPARLESLEVKIAGHYMAAAGLFCRARKEEERALEHPNGIGPAAVTMRIADLAGREALSLKEYAVAVGDDHDKAVKALSKASELLDLSSATQWNESWTLRKVGVLQDLALALAKSGEYAMSEGKLIDAIAEQEKLDDAKAAHRETLTNLYKYLAIARRARGDMPGAKKALDRVESLGGSAGLEEVEGLNRLLGRNRITMDVSASSGE